MFDLKPYHDKVLAADAKRKELAAQIDGLLKSETEEGNAEAMKLLPDLDAAQNSHDDALKVYNSLTAATAPSDVAKNFVPVSATAAAAGKEARIISRADFNALDQISRAAFVKEGGKVLDTVEA